MVGQANEEHVIRVSLTLKGFLKNYFEREETSELEYPKGSSVQDVLNQAAVPLHMVSIVTVNGEIKSLEHILCGDDHVIVYPLVIGG